MKKRIFALVLALVLCFSALPLGALAAPSPLKTKTEGVYKVVNISDSTGIGVGLNDYGPYRERDYITDDVEPAIFCPGEKGLGFGEYCSEHSYPVLLTEYLREKLPELEVRFSNLGISGVRACELRKIIDPEFISDGLAESEAARLEWLIPWVCDFDEDGTDLTEYFQRELKSADLITVDACLNSFTTYLIGRLGTPDDERFADENARLFEQYSYTLAGLVRDFKRLAENTLGALLPENLALKAVDAFMYCLGDMMVNFDGLIRDIRKLNPTAKLLVGGVYNAFSGLTLEYEGYELEITDLLDAGVALIDEYLSTLCPSRREYTFFDIPNDTETIRMQLQQYESIWELPVETLDRAIDDLFGGDHSLIATPLCVYIRSLAAERGIPYGIYSGIYPREVFAAFEEVRAMREGGAEADAMTQLVVEYFEKYLQLALDGLNTTTLDVPGLIEAFSLENPYLALFELIDIPFEELTPAQKTLAHYVGSKLRGGACVHFSRLGCEQKFEAAKAELDKELPTPILCYSVQYTNQLTTGIVRTIIKAVRLITRSASRLLTGFLK